MFVVRTKCLVGLTHIVYTEAEEEHGEEAGRGVAIALPVLKKRR